MSITLASGQRSSFPQPIQTAVMEAKPPAVARPREAPVPEGAPHPNNVHYASPSTATSAVRARLDDYLKSFAGPYFIDGLSVAAPSQFRMVGGFNDDNAGIVLLRGAAHANPNSPRLRELLAICAQAHLPYPGHCLMGCPTAHELVRVTQALIDAGRLPAGPESQQVRVKALQWRYGIGIDCTDYVLGAALAARGKSEREVSIRVMGSTLPQPGVDYFATARTNPHLTRVDITTARAGDLVCLDDPGSVGHRAVIYDRQIYADADRAKLAEKYGEACRAFLVGGPVHCFTVDSSWGAGNMGAAYGGVRRDTWFFNESTRTWAQLSARVSQGESAIFQQTGSGPVSEVLQGIYRFK